MKLILTGVLVFLNFYAVHSQNKDVDSSILVKDNFTLVPLPVIYYTPETRWAFGGVGFFSFRFKSQSAESRNSQFQFGAAYTQEKQSLFYLPFQFFWKEDQFYSFGEVGYYKYTYNYWGIGSNTPDYNIENYGVNFTRVRMNVTKRIGSSFYFGGRYWFDNYNVNKVINDGLLSQENNLGEKGGVVSSLGLIGIYDTRDNYNFPTKGTYLEFVATQNGPYLGSPFEYTRLSIDAVKYINLVSDNILALNAYAINTIGQPPFNEMALLGGRRKMRGYYEGRYRDLNLLVFQGEYRIPLFWRLGVVGFGGVAAVANSFSNFKLSTLKPSYGGGIRFALDEDDKVNIRLDMGFGENSSGFYLTIGEAF